jgi:hypothetical protein
MFISVIFLYQASQGVGIELNTQTDILNYKGAIKFDT